MLVLTADSSYYAVLLRVVRLWRAGAMGIANVRKHQKRPMPHWTFLMLSIGVFVFALGCQDSFLHDAVYRGTKQDSQY